MSVWWDWRKRKDDRKRKIEQKRKDDKKKERQREEERRRADGEKIAAILSQKHDEVMKTFRNLEKSVNTLKAKEIETGPSGTFTQFDVLLFMCHPDNWETFSKA